MKKLHPKQLLLICIPVLIVIGIQFAPISFWQFGVPARTVIFPSFRFEDSGPKAAEGPLHLGSDSLVVAGTVEKTATVTIADGDTTWYFYLIDFLPGEVLQGTVDRQRLSLVSGRCYTNRKSSDTFPATQFLQGLHPGVHTCFVLNSYSDTDSWTICGKSLPCTAIGSHSMMNRLLVTENGLTTLDHTPVILSP